MKVCPHCKAENEDQYIYCANCRQSLPKKTRLDLKFKNGAEALMKGDYKKALRTFDDILKLNIGDKDAWFMKGISLLKLKDRAGAMESFERAGMKVGGGTCANCRGFKRCPDCGGQGGCYMCRGTGRCSICHGSGECPRCGGRDSLDPNCKMCGGTKQCPRCKGSGDCNECNGNGACACAGSGICPYCGGSGHSIQLNLADIPPHLRQYIPDLD